jgi:hypothetical protein
MSECPSDSQRLLDSASTIYRSNSGGGGDRLLRESFACSGSCRYKFISSDLKTDQSGVFFTTTLITIYTTPCPRRPVLITFTGRRGEWQKKKKKNKNLFNILIKFNFYSISVIVSSKKMLKSSPRIVSQLKT